MVLVLQVRKRKHSQLKELAYSYPTVGGTGLWGSDLNHCRSQDLDSPEA